MFVDGGIWGCVTQLSLVTGLSWARLVYPKNFTPLVLETEYSSCYFHRPYSTQGWGESGAPERMSPAFNALLSRADETENPLGMEVTGERGTKSQNRSQRTFAGRNCLKYYETYRSFCSLFSCCPSRREASCSHCPVHQLKDTGYRRVETSPGWWSVLSLMGLHRNRKGPPHRVGALLAEGACGREAAAVPGGGRGFTSP